MKEQEFVFEFLDALRNAVPDKYSVRTDGGDADATPPLCILDWNATRLDGELGSNPFAGVLRNEKGEATGREYHRYYKMEFEITVRSYDEGERDTVLTSISDDLTPYEYRSEWFDSDTYSWLIEDIKPKSFSVVERDWYEGFLMVRSGYVNRVQQTAERLREVQENINRTDG